MAEVLGDLLGLFLRGHEKNQVQKNRATFAAQSLVSEDGKIVPATCTRHHDSLR